MAIPLFARFPRVWAETTSWPVIPPDERAPYPALSDDFAVIDEVIAPAFEKYDRAALRDQNRYRHQQVIILIGSALVSALGGVQAVFSEQRWPGIALTVLGFALSFSTKWARERAALDGYMSARVKAERLRALHFQFLACSGRYAGPDRVRNLRRAVRDIGNGKEPA